MIARHLADAETDLLTNPRPVLFFDTCDVLNLFQVVTTVPLVELRAVNRFLTALAANPQRCQPVGTYVIAVEYIQKTDATNPVYQIDILNNRLPPPDEVSNHLEKIDAQIHRLHLIRQELGQPLPAEPIVYANLNLLADLRATADHERQQERLRTGDRNTATPPTFGTGTKAINPSLHPHSLVPTRRSCGRRSGAPSRAPKKLAKPYLYPTKATARVAQMGVADEEVLTHPKPGNPPRRIPLSVQVRFCQFFLRHFRLRHNRRPPTRRRAGDDLLTMG